MAALKDLPKDLAETYIRIFESIPEADRDFVHRVLIWIYGHSTGLWLTDTGIDADLLVSAVSYDLSPASPDSKPVVYDSDDLRELCGCLITFSSESEDMPKEKQENSESLDTIDQKQGRQIAGPPSLVSLAHYTVMEFLTSPLILKTYVSQFALDEGIIFNEFALSCIKQALSASPEGKSTDWEKDREAYCLTIVCAFGLRFIYFEDRLDIQDLWMQYYDPARSHFARLPSIQSRIIHSPGLSRNYMLRRLPILQNAQQTLTQTQLQAATMLNLLCASAMPPEPLLRFMKGKNAKDILQVRLPVQVNQSTLEGTIPEILLQHTRYGKSLRWILKTYSSYVNTSRLLMGLVGVDIGSGCDHQNTGDMLCNFSQLLVLGADPNGSHHKVTPLQLAAYRCDYNAVKLLLNSGADPNSVGDIDGEEVKGCQRVENSSQSTLMVMALSCTPLQILKTRRFSKRRKGIQIQRLLIEYGARENLGKEEEVKSRSSR